jgi:NNP family nitrate/nitrite transporter-like MFS transporter
LGLFAVFLFLFGATGVGNASTFQMIPFIFLKLRQRVLEATGEAEGVICREAEKESAATIGFTSVVAACGAFFIPKSYGTSISMTGGFYVTCVGVTWWYYVCKNAEVKC